MSKSNDEQYWDGFDNGFDYGVKSTYVTICDEIKRDIESDEQVDLLYILEDFISKVEERFGVSVREKGNKE